MVILAVAMAATGCDKMDRLPGCNMLSKNTPNGVYLSGELVCELNSMKYDIYSFSGGTTGPFTDYDWYKCTAVSLWQRKLSSTEKKGPDIMNAYDVEINAIAPSDDQGLFTDNIYSVTLKNEAVIKGRYEKTFFDTGVRLVYDKSETGASSKISYKVYSFDFDPADHVSDAEEDLPFGNIKIRIYDEDTNDVIDIIFNGRMIPNWVTLF